MALTSYSLYLTHKAVYGLIHAHLGHWVDGHGARTLAVYAVAVLSAGALLHYSVERPFLKLRQRVRAVHARRSGVPVPVSAAWMGTEGAL